MNAAPHIKVIGIIVQSDMPLNAGPVAENALIQSKLDKNPT